MYTRKAKAYIQERIYDEALNRNGDSERPIEHLMVIEKVIQKVHFSLVKGNGGESMGYEGHGRGNREMHKVTCSDCGNEAEVPFKPTEGRPVYCRECFQKHRPPRRY
jgi:CxxC-x17-CxxC domain-containing protein